MKINLYGDSEFLDLREYENIVLYGAGALGKELLNALHANNISVSSIWDKNADSLNAISINDKFYKVEQPFSGHCNPSTTLVICAIISIETYRSVSAWLISSGYKNILRGAYIYMSLVCLQTRENLNIKECKTNPLCTPVFCDKVKSFLRPTALSAGRGCLELDEIDVRINNVCNLKCKHCNQYITQIKLSKKIIMNSGQLIDDINLLFSAIDYVNNVNIEGGEPFLNKDLDKVLNVLVKISNIGFIQIITNAFIDIPDQYANTLRNPKISLLISNYEKYATEREMTILQNNLKFLSKHDIAYHIYGKDDHWYEVPEVVHRSKDSEQCRRDFARCCVKQNILWNGRFYACLMTPAIDNLTDFDFPTDYVDIRKYGKLELKDLLVAFKNNTEYMQSCQYCGFAEPRTISIAGEQA